MAKRFTDTAKWNKQGFSNLSLKMKCVWIYLCDNCDHAGIWDVNLRLLSFQLGEQVTEAEIKEAFGDKALFLSRTKLFLPTFIEFQYGSLNPDNRVHKSIIDRLEKEGASKPLVSPLQGAKDKDKDKDKEEDKDSSFKGGLGEISATARHAAHFVFDFVALFNLYPRQQKKTQSLTIMASQIRTQADYDMVKAAIIRYEATMQREGTAFSHVLTFPNWWLEWEDWTDPAAGTSKIGPTKQSQEDFIAKLEARKAAIIKNQGGSI